MYCLTGLDEELLGNLQGGLHPGTPEMTKTDISGGCCFPTAGYQEPSPWYVPVFMAYRDGSSVTQLLVIQTPPLREVIVGICEKLA